MSSPLKRAFAVLGVAALAATGIALTAAPAQAATSGSVVWSDQSCDIDNGGTSVDGADFTVTNNDTEAALTFTVNNLDAGNAELVPAVTVAPGDSHRIVIPLAEDSLTTIQLHGTGDSSDFFAGHQFEVNCVPNYNPDATGSIQTSCLLPTGGAVGDIAGVEFTFDNTSGDGPATYSFIAGDTVLEGNLTVAAGETRVRSTTLDEDQATNLRVETVDADGAPVVLAEQDATLNCVADTPVITVPSDGQAFTSSTVEIRGTGTAGDVVTVGVFDASKFDVSDEGNASSQKAFAATADPVTLPTESGDGFTLYTATVADDGTFAVSASGLPDGDYGVAAQAARTATDDHAASVSTLSNIVRFSVDTVVAPAGTVPTVDDGTVAGTGSNGGQLASTGLNPAFAGGTGGLLLLAGVGAFVLYRRRSVIQGG